jgi:lysophospholipase L1-like esterase
MNNRIEINKRSLNFNLKKYNEAIKDFCKKKRLQLIDINKKSLDCKNYCLPLPDGIHLNRNGVKFYSNIILNYLIKIIDEKNI